MTTTPKKSGGANAPGARALRRASTKLDKALEDLERAGEHLGVPNTKLADAYANTMTARNLVLRLWATEVS